MLELKNANFVNALINVKLRHTYFKFVWLVSFDEVKSSFI